VFVSSSLGQCVRRCARCPWPGCTPGHWTGANPADFLRSNWPRS